MIIPTPEPIVKPVETDPWSGAAFYDVTLVHMTQALIASGKYAPGALLMELAVAATSQIMIQTGRWTGADLAEMDLETATRRVIDWTGSRR